MPIGLKQSGSLPDMIDGDSFVDVVGVILVHSLVVELSLKQIFLEISSCEIVLALPLPLQEAENQSIFSQPSEVRLQVH
jgi:hypothetical protein